MAVVGCERPPVRAAYVAGRSHSRFYYGAKRAMDVIAALALLILALPLLVVIAIAVKLDTPGPALFVQDRVGSRRRKGDEGYEWSISPYRFFKFRTMVNDADTAVHRQHIAAYIAGDDGRLNGGSPDHASPEPKSYKLQDDPRVTRVGRLLRQTSLDELPQLVNVLKGDMSLVGPRPPLAYEVDMFADHHMGRFACPPGITGLAQVEGRCTLTFEEMIECDLHYAASTSLARDVLILLRTVRVVVTREGAG